MKSEKYAKNARVLDMYYRLCQGKVINKAEAAGRYGVDERSIQRDIDDIRAFLDELNVSGGSDGRRIEYSRGDKGFYMTGNEERLLNNSEILAVSKILLESRAFTRKEIGSILNKLVEQCVPQRNQKVVSDLIANEKYHYVELSHPSRFCFRNTIFIFSPISRSESRRTAS